MYIVTGASDGLGLALAKLLVAKGERVISLSRSKPKAKGVGHITCDLTNEVSINQAAAELLVIDEPLTALVNCAGVFSKEPLTSLTGREIARVFTTNIIGPMILVSRLLERIKKDEADIIDVASTAGLKANSEWSTYSTSKWAMRGFTQNLQEALKNSPSRVISLCPGGMQTELFEKSDVTMPIKEYMDPAAIAEFIMQMLALPKNVQVTEAIINRK